MIQTGLEFGVKTLDFLLKILDHIPDIDHRLKKELQGLLENQINLESLLLEQMQKDKFISRVVVGLTREIAEGEKRIENFYEIWGMELSQKNK